MCLFNSAPAPQPVAPPPVVDTTDTSSDTYKTAAGNAAKKAALAKGQDSTILTSPLGSTGSSANIAQKTLLGQ